MRRRWLFGGAVGIVFAAGLSLALRRGLQARMATAFVPGGTLPVATSLRGFELPARDDVPAHAVRVQLWYPAASTGRETPQRPGAWPLLIYLPGWGGSLSENSVLAQDLASRGFIVAAVDLRTEQPAGFTAEAARMELPMDLSAMARLPQTIALADWRVRLLAGDAVALLDLLPAHTATGILGFSFGGAVAAEACARDRRFAACANLDGWLFGAGGELRFPQPYLVFSTDALPDAPQPADSPSATLDERDNALMRARLARQGGWFVTIDGTVHTSFIDAITPAADAVRAITAAFFQAALQGRASALLSTGEPFPGVHVRHAGAPQ